MGAPNNPVDCFCATLKSEPLSFNSRKPFVSTTLTPSSDAVGAAVSIDSTGWTDCVLWNPYKTMGEYYKEFVCVENARFPMPVKLKPGQDWNATTVMDVVDVKSD
jgi:hypothetical protein